ncbi:MAG TPA: primase-like DNA-binding domain-containing protein, partial [Elusimicrobiales bacterium]|nr:primase-like DNA-binding domain-containing protein [Elusimicrobiales bacterium]
NPPACVLSATEEYLESEDALGRWISEECFQNPRAKEGSDALYQSWKAWCEKNGEYLPSLRKFSDDLHKRGFKRARSERQRFFQGIALNGTKVQEDLL